jgi:NADPH:quinone reductase-like Zn-dependent oxidoreductase
VARVVAAKLLSRFGRRKFVPHLTDTTQEDLVLLTELIEAGKVSPVIDRRYPLSGVPDAIRYLETVHARGEVVITQ